MTERKLAQNFTLIALNAQDSRYMTAVKKIALRCMAAAVILEVYLDGGFTRTGNRLVLKDEVSAEFSELSYQNIIFKPLLRKNSKSANLEWWLKSAARLPNRQLVKLEHTIVHSLKEQKLIEEIPNLLGCDLYYDSAGVRVKEYRSSLREYMAITENIRADTLEEGAVTDENICLLWLLRESGCMYDFFSRNEMEKAAIRMNELYHSTPLGKELLLIRVHRGVEFAVKQFLHFKKSVMRTRVGSGINFVFPMLERSQSVFIDTEAWFSNSQKRLDDVRARLESNGHAFIVLQEGQVPLIKIDNVVYEAIPQAIYGRVPIHGVRLLPRHPV